MMDVRGYRAWLDQRRPKFAPSTITTYVRDAQRVEEYYGDLDAHYRNDRLEGILQDLRFTEDDFSQGASNPSKIPILPKIPGDYRVLNSYATTIRKYRAFRESQPSH